MQAAQPIRVYDEIKDAYLRYYETAFRVADGGIAEERRERLTRPGAIFTEPVLEPVMPFASGDTIADVCAEAGMSTPVARRLARAIFDAEPDFVLYQHQSDALRSALSTSGRYNPVVTAGTGSGKTESFLLPIFARVLEEAERNAWPAGQQEQRWWEVGVSGRWAASRDPSSPRPAAVRALLLYPTNALVEDQMTRLRRAVRLAAESGPRIFFGRYTGVTLGTGDIPTRMSRRAVREAASELRAMEDESDSIELGDNPDLRFEFPDPRHGEMLTRWDMIVAPPDILVTNYSMLNVVLMREREAGMFALTREWLASDERNVFTLVVDELHQHRGAAGSEVALVVRNLLDRLGLAPDSPQLRCIATSASLDGPTGLKYVEQFFGVPRSRFAIVPGTPAPLPPAPELTRTDFEGLAEDDDAAFDALAEKYTPAGLAHALAASCLDDEGHPQPAGLSDVERAVFGGYDSESTALAALLQAVARGPANRSNPTFRAHIEHPDVIRDVVARLSTFTGTEPEVQAEVARWVQMELPEAIDGVAGGDSPFRHPDLSELLANAGLLPMFGFPTRSRRLYVENPDLTGDIEAATVQDRDIEQAVSMFAPGAEVVRDKMKHTAVGFAAWILENDKPVAVDALGEARRLHRCSTCRSTLPARDDGGGCPACGEPMDEFTMYEPLGFRTDFHAVDFDDSVERGAFAARPELGLPPGDPVARDVNPRLSASVWHGADIFTVNDNDGRFFALQRDPRVRGSWVATDPGLYTEQPSGLDDEDAEFRAAIGAVRRTDVLTLSLHDLPLHGTGGSVNTSLEGGQRLAPGEAALWSFASAFRRTAATYLDIGAEELQAGLQPTAAGATNLRTARVFFADQVANGAGYAVELGRQEVLLAVLERMRDEMAAQLVEPTHLDSCDSSCPNCLRSYDNRWLHPVLDWRLALDVLDLVRDGVLDESRWFAEAPRLVQRFVEGNLTLGGVERFEWAGLQGVFVAESRRAAVFGHPLWRVSTDDHDPRFSDAFARATQEVGPSTMQAFDLFTLTRNPGVPLGWLTGGAI